MKCSVVGATGYTGSELVKLLAGHPYVSIHMLTTSQAEPADIRRFMPALPKASPLKLESFDLDRVAGGSDVVFLALPHTTAARLAGTFLKKRKLVIDLSADLRLKHAADYDVWYGFRHPNPKLLKAAVYGLPEVHREAIQKADLIANPGCYPTGSILALKPLLERKLIDVSSIVIDAKSGVSGAGRKLSEGTQFCEVNENFGAYKVNVHQHQPEIEQELSAISGRRVRVTFVPHLLPVQRGILTTVYAALKPGIRKSRVFEAFRGSYDGEPFVRVLAEGTFPSLRDVQHTNYCAVGISVSVRTGRVVVISAIDNLMKGASGQAVQNMNIRCGFPEEAGLTACLSKN